MQQQMAKMFLRMFMLLIMSAFLNGQKHVCLKTKYSEGKLNLMCTINKLINHVKFIDPLGQQRGDCRPPLRLSLTDPTICSKNVTQDLETNITTLTVSTNDTNINGEWTCNHGTADGSDKLFVNVTEQITCAMFEMKGKSAGLWIGLTVVLSVILGILGAYMLYQRLSESPDGYNPVGNQEDLSSSGDDDDSNKDNQCDKCKMKTVCAVCFDCNHMFCEICCRTHNDRYSDNHRVYQLEHGITTDTNIQCYLCKNKLANTFCISCKGLFCINCSLLSKTNDGSHKHNLKNVFHSHISMPNTHVKTDYITDYKYRIKTSDISQSRLCGVSFLDGNRIIVADFNDNFLMVYENYSLRIKYKLDQEPKGLVKITNKSVAVTFPYVKQLIIYNVDEKQITIDKAIPMDRIGKPFSIAFSEGHFAVEVGEGDDGKIVVIDENGTLKHEIMNTNDIAHFTSNTIRLALDYERGKIFVVAVSKKEVLSVDFSGNILWKKSLASPRGIVFVKNAMTEKNIIVASKRWNLVYKVNSSNGRSDIIMGEGHIEGPRYIDYNLEKNLFCIHIDNGDVLVYNYDIKKPH